MKEFLHYFTAFFDGSILIYVILIVSSYLILAVFSAKALIEYLREAKFLDAQQLMASPLAPSVSLIAPAYNEANTIVENVRFLLAIQYPNLDVIIVNDGSKDNTLQLMIDAYALVPVFMPVDAKIATKEVRQVYKSTKAVYSNLTILDKQNGGKADALNCGLNYSKAQYIACIDVDCVLSQDAVVKMIQPFLSGKVPCIAVGGVIRIANSCIIEDGRLISVRMPDNWLARFQVLEYIRAFLMGRMGWSKADGLLLISGAFGIFSREIALSAGGYDHNTVGEDMELIVRMRRYMIEKGLKYRVEFIPDPLCWTEAPATYKVLGRQRNRWMRGTIETLLQHKKMFFNPKYKILGMLSYPYWLFFEWLAPIIELVGLLYLFILVLLGQPNMLFSISMFVMVFAFALFMSTLAILFDEFTFFQYKRKRDVLRLVVVAILEPFIHHPMTVRWGIQGNIDFLKGKKSWGEMTRTGFATKKAKK
jgi:cellulose synthase/poly-beta-1,6-N-acetylglucosamine synthase-like glycosyltransferase